MNDLPELHSAEFDRAGIDALLEDIRACAELLAIIPRFEARVAMGDVVSIPLDEARALLDAGKVRGLQIRYRYQGEEWWDTVMVGGGRYRVVRIRPPAGTG